MTLTLSKDTGPLGWPDSGLSQFTLQEGAAPGTLGSTLNISQGYMVTPGCQEPKTQNRAQSGRMVGHSTGKNRVRTKT